MRLSLCWLLLLSSTAFAGSIGPEKGSLVIVGGGRMGKAIVREFLDRAGGLNASIVVVPSANDGDDWGPTYLENHFLTKAGAKHLTIMHTRDRLVADSDRFVAPLRTATGVWFDGGRQWRLADSYLNTRMHKELLQVLSRGGVVGGSSAGATILGSYLVRGAPEGNKTMMAKGHEEGFGLLNHTAIDQHVLARHRENDLAEVIAAHPELLGIGIDESTAIVVTEDRFKVIGASKVVIHHKAVIPTDGRQFELLSPGEEFDLEHRKRIKTTNKSLSP